MALESTRESHLRFRPAANRTSGNRVLSTVLPARFTQCAQPHAHHPPGHLRRHRHPCRPATPIPRRDRPCRPGRAGCRSPLHDPGRTGGKPRRLARRAGITAHRDWRLRPHTKSPSRPKPLRPGSLRPWRQLGSAFPLSSSSCLFVFFVAIPSTVFLGQIATKNTKSHKDLKEEYYSQQVSRELVRYRPRAYRVGKLSVFNSSAVSTRLKTATPSMKSCVPWSSGSLPRPRARPNVKGAPSRSP